MGNQSEIRVHDLKSASAILNIRTASLRKFIKQGRLKAAICGNRYLLTDEMITNFLNDSVGLSKAGRPGQIK